ncbi:MAG: dihydropteroate synthase [Eubacteriales bacterium]|nr:dihydropteroate synthase [Eubacteriales bacterium]
MILFGEKLNSSIPAARKALTRRDEVAVRRLCTAQADAGADYLDINTAMMGDQEWEAMRWVLDIALESTACGVMIDTPNVQVGRQALEYVRSKERPMIFNSITLNDRVELADLISDLKCGVVALPIGERMPVSADERFANAVTLAQLMVECGISPQNIYMDILITALATDMTAGRQALDTLEKIHTSLPGIHLTCGLSNLSFGLPKRKLINQAFLHYAVEKGLDSAIVDVTDPAMALGALAAAAVLGRDDFCMEYVTRAK